MSFPIFLKARLKFQRLESDSTFQCIDIPQTLVNSDTKETCHGSRKYKHQCQYRPKCDGQNDRVLSKTMEQLSTGNRINSAADDAAGLAISTRMTSQINGLNVAIKNANDGVNMINTAEGALIEVTNMLQRMRELALEASNGTTDTNDRTYMNLEYRALVDEMQRVATKTEWNGRTILDSTADGSTGSAVKYQIGVDVGTTLTVNFGDFRNSASGGVLFDFRSGVARTDSAVLQQVQQQVRRWRLMEQVIRATLVLRLVSLPLRPVLRRLSPTR